MSITPSRHELQFGEGFSWAPPPETVTYYVWAKRDAAAGAPRWAQVMGANVVNETVIAIDGESTPLTLAPSGVVADWARVVSLFDGYDPEVAMITALNAGERLLSIDIYAMPRPNDTDAATIAASERKFLEHLLFQRVRAGGGCRAREDRRPERHGGRAYRARRTRSPGG